MTNRIDVMFHEASASGRTVLAPFVTIGFPDVDPSVSIAEALLSSGGDVLELGVPFSDPLADGATVQKASFHALRQGVTVRTCLDVVRRLRERRVEDPLLLMGYFNPFLRYGLAGFAKDAAKAGVDGMIVPDLPPEEAGPFMRECDRHGLYLVPLVAPTSTDKRIAQACKQAKGFIYCVSLTGVTGARAEIREGVSRLVERIRRHTNLPVLVGFGVSKREHVQEIARYADGAVFASAMLDAIDRAPRGRAVETAGEFVKGLQPLTE